MGAEGAGLAAGVVGEGGPEEGVAFKGGLGGLAGLKGHAVGPASDGAGGQLGGAPGLVVGCAHEEAPEGAHVLLQFAEHHQGAVLGQGCHPGRVAGLVWAAQKEFAGGRGGQGALLTSGGGDAVEEPEGLPGGGRQREGLACQDVHARRQRVGQVMQGLRGGGVEEQDAVVIAVRPPPWRGGVRADVAQALGGGQAGHALAEFAAQGGHRVRVGAQGVEPRGAEQELDGLLAALAAKGQVRDQGAEPGRRDPLDA
ncbi:hypothetical protein DL240_18475 [Lujinxingia litoralis]|uniref:Uncharacterized protein n=1 Tax=Lujinxingia litoralis TaxID=2211119 RepID=A0A328C6R3_9DELT|nr:hypothetical protein DL240_18475 [Lujinxingia litoralis]